MTHTKRTRIAAGIWQLKKGELYEIRVRVQHPRTRRWVTRWQRFKGTRAQALMTREQWRVELLDELANPRRRETLASYAKSWMTTKLDRGDLAASTARKYADTLDLHVLPELGDVLIDVLTTRDISEWLARKARAHASSTCNTMLRVIAVLLADARTDGLIVVNPAEAVRALRERHDEGAEDNSLTPNELRLYLAAWKEVYPNFYALVLVLALTGMRWGEATALKWADFEDAEKSGMLRIRRSHWCGKIKETKTGKVRNVPYVPVLADAIKELRLRAKADEKQSDFCFVARNGKLLRHGRLSAENADVLKKAGITRRVTIHGLRRTMTDLLRLSAVDQVTAAALIGHDTERMRRHYSTVRPQEARAAGERVLRLIANARADGRGDGRSTERRKRKASQAGT